jgi:hypothetical protein
MSNTIEKENKIEISRTILIISLIFILTLSLSGCNFIAEEKDEDLEKTQDALELQQTIMAQQATIDAQNSQATSQSEQPVDFEATEAAVQQPSVDIEATQLALAAQQTAAAQQQIQATQPPPPTQPPLQEPTVASQDFTEMMKSASILLYEDMVEIPAEYRYVKRTLDTMGLRYKDDGNAMGWLKSDLLGGSPAGGPWDLVIIAAEFREQVSGEYFDYLNDILNQGTSVIVEAWYLDQVSEGKVSTILTKCGVQVYPYFPATGSVNDVIVWPLPGMSSHPLLSQPNGGLRFTKARDTWLWTFDLGDHTAYTGRGDAQILMGTDAQDGNKDGVLTVCMGGQFTLMTFSSHSFPYDIMYPLWENMIYNALKIRLTGSY